jgi:uncharacterized protein YndB with AHSA1/START domain
LRILISAIMLLILALPSWASAQLRPMVYAEVTVERSPDDAFTDWTTAEGIEAFFAKKAFIEAEPGGNYALWFAPDAPEGTRGSDHGKVLGLQPGRMLSVTWDMPPYMPEIRPHQTVLQILFEPVGEEKTRVRLFHTGFGEGEVWEKGHDYFETTWPTVLSGYKDYTEK